MLIDSHAHLDYEYDVDVSTLLSDAKSVGVNHVIAIAAAPNSLANVKKLADEHDNVFHTSGIHPHEAKDFNDAIFEEVKKFSKEPKCVAIGELGLDYYYDLSPKEPQLEAIRKQLDYSVEIGKPVVVHSRDAEQDTIDCLKPHAKAWLKKYPSRAPGVIHCFTGSADLAQACLEMGYYISFSGIITFKSADDLRKTVKDIVPMERLLVETDSPYLAPVPHRGKKNRPQHTRVVAEKVAELKGLSLERVAEITRKNTIDLFQLPID